MIESERHPDRRFKQGAHGFEVHVGASEKPRGELRLVARQFLATNLLPQNVGAFGDQEIGREKAMAPEAESLLRSRLLDHPLDGDARVDDECLHRSSRLSRSNSSAGVCCRFAVSAENRPLGCRSRLPLRRSTPGAGCRAPPLPPNARAWRPDASIGRASRRPGSAHLGWPWVASLSSMATLAYFRPAGNHGVASSTPYRLLSASTDRASPGRTGGLHGARTPGFMIPAGSSARLAASSALPNRAGRCARYQAMWSRPTA